MAEFGRISWQSANLSNSLVEEWRPIIECHESDGLFSIVAQLEEARLSLIATCDNSHGGKFHLSCGDRVLLKGKARVVRAPAIVEEDGFSFPPGAHFGAGTWEIECIATDGQRYRAIAEVCDWTSTD